ncbi:metal ABC transporter substrate-binding protein [Kitasatospora sp. MMS16-BH015]|uniref:STAS domain-containing protein n=1 Tax=Kitasatospora sp. MMS16-BH015 TaxID=2018025 RepID=UPI000CA24275|nr:STAS domain-containing protein [Kitasatospora sp. MMS16-BH015]AUG81671.1 metal ABC transporter substrate-binding protein [Kitasatospora sp. MMS16-BH015]
MPSSATEGPGPAADRLRVDLRLHDRAVVVSAAGELDQDSVGLLHERLVEALGTPGADRLVVDCARLLFCDSTGLNALLTARRDAESAGRELVLADLQPAVARVFEITGAGAVFEIRPDLESAVAR